MWKHVFSTEEFPKPRLLHLWMSCEQMAREDADNRAAGLSLTWEEEAERWASKIREEDRRRWLEHDIPSIFGECHAL